MTDHTNTFPGFPPEPVTNYWPYPKALNGWWYILTPSEQKVLDYILRHTWGYKKVADSISHSQFIKGITKRDGTVVDKGTGIKDERTIRKALQGLEQKGFIETEATLGRENLYKLKINPSQEMSPPTQNDTSPLPSDATATPSQGLSPTIKDISIKDTNNIPVGQEIKKEKYKEIPLLISYLSKKLGGIRFPNYGKQARFARQILDAGYSLDDAYWAIDKMAVDKWWSQNSFDMKNVADEIPKLMTRTYKEEKS